MVVREQDNRSGRARSLTKMESPKVPSKGGEIGRKASYLLLQLDDTKIFKPF